MKKVIALILSLLLMLALCACGSKTDEPAQNEPQPTQTEPETTLAITTEPATETPVTEEPAEQAPASDVSWTNGDVVFPIPEPPFAEVNVSFSENQNLYMIIDVSDISARANYDALAAYCNALQNAGYTTIEKELVSANAFQTEVSSMGASTLFTVSSSTGHRVMVYQEESTPMVWIYFPAEN